MKHIRLMGKGKCVALAASDLDSAACANCVSKMQGDYNACVAKGKCDLPDAT